MVGVNHLIMSRRHKYTFFTGKRTKNSIILTIFEVLATAFNRTILELKYIQRIMGKPIYLSFNRTILELKL